ncbi:MAG: heterodisulfide reductase-related iron-sulfur binding cluster [Pseudomonadota bacterium]
MIARPLYWNIDLFSKVSMYVLAVVAFVIFAYGVKQRVAYWRQAKPEGERWSSWASRLGFILNELVLQRTVLKKGFAGVFHSFIFYSFVACAIATAAAFIETDFIVFFNHATNAQGGYDQLLFDGIIYDILSFGAELGGVLILVGVGMAAWRRYVQKPANLERKTDDLRALSLIALIIVTGFISEAIRIHHTGETHPWTSFFAYLLALPFGMPATPVLDAHAGSSIAHKLFWWLHMVLAMGFIALIPYTKLFHLLAIPTGVLKARLTANDPLPRVDLDTLMADENFDYDSFSLGMGSEKAFTFEQRVDHDACIECGRCQDVCPASRAGDPFGPKDYIGKLRDYGKKVMEARAAWEAKPAAEGQEKEPFEVPPLIGEGAPFDENFVFYCRTCRACMEVCPAKIEHVPAFIEQRRNEVGINGRMPEEAQAPLRQLQSTMNALGAQEDRVDWITRTGVRVVGPEEECEVLYFVGCLSSLDVTKQKIAEDLFKVLTAAGVDFGVLGEEETCCGDPARVIGDEMTYQMIAKAQAESIKSRKYKTLLVSCPHCFHNLANEYKTFGVELPVMHHSQYLQQLLAEGKIKLEGSLGKKVAFHDPCYLGRYQRIFAPPRQVLGAIPGAQVTELAEHHEEALCCGAGGGHFWMDFEAPKRINNLRMKQATEAGAEVVATGCPYCMQMLVDSIAILDLDEKVKVQDLATLVAERLPKVEAPAEEA